MNIFLDTQLLYETGLLIGHTYILFHFIFQLLVQKHKISCIKGVSFSCGLVWLNWIILSIFWREVGMSWANMRPGVRPGDTPTCLQIFLKLRKLKTKPNGRLQIYRHTYPFGLPPFG